MCSQSHNLNVRVVLTHEFILIVEERSMIQDEQPLPEHPEIVVFASFSGPPKYPVRISVLGEMVRIANIHLERRNIHFKQECTPVGSLQRGKGSAYREGGAITGKFAK